MREDRDVLWAAHNGNLRFLKYLIEIEGADINIEDGWALAYAAKNNNVEMMEYLIEHGIDVNAGKVIPNRALKKAIENGCVEAIEYLLSKIAGKKDNKKEILEFVKQEAIVEEALRRSGKNVRNKRRKQKAIK